MKLLRTLGLGSRKLIHRNHTVPGTVTEVKTCHWLKVNQRSLRATPLDGAAFPHILHFTYQVDGTIYRGSRFVNWNLPCPGKGAAVTVYYDPSAPARCTVSI